MLDLDDLYRVCKQGDYRLVASGALTLMSQSSMLVQNKENWISGCVQCHGIGGK